MKIWCFDHASLSYNIHSDLYFSKEEAQARYDAYNFDGAYRKLYQVEDIWGWCARNFDQVIHEIIASRDNGDNYTYIYGIADEVREAAEHCGVEHCSVDAFWADGNDKFVFSVAWLQDGKLFHYTDCFNGFDTRYDYPTIVERRSKWQK
jgi:hypothetical protein